MAILILLLLLLPTLRACRRIASLRRRGMSAQAQKQYRIAAWRLGSLIWLAMAVQELILLKGGQLTWRTGLPLHLCSLLGVLTLPMLLTGHPVLRSAAFFAGMPGAALALAYPAMLATPWPRLTSLAFHTLHAGLICAPVLSMSLGWRPRAADAVSAWFFLLLACIASAAANTLTGGNYLFLAGPVSGTPLEAMAQYGLAVYRGLLMFSATFVLTIEAAAVHALEKRRYSA
ncbi:MAG: YwaF family protein [Clostridia bacterium]|nr:YwaF family protein [Clostridia bacterium]